ncbi:MAG: hypothetical protein AB2417_09195 [Clostridiaceae bacterium]
MLDKMNLKINWNNFYVCKDCTCYNDNISFNLTPEDFLRFAKEDYKELDNKGLVGVLSNSKRAIDCQVDWIISYLGFDYLNFNESNYPELRVLIDEFESDLRCNKDCSFKLRFIQALEIAPTFLISKIRKFRNKLEHEYMLPKENEAREAIEIAELFINATQNVIWHKFFSDYVVQNKYCEEKNNITIPFIRISFNSGYEKKSEINIYHKMDDTSKEQIILKPENKEYIYFIKAAISHKFHYLPLAFNCNINLKYINYKIREF